MVFSQYPHYSCCTTGSNLNAMYRFYTSHQLPSTANWIFIDRWPVHSAITQVLFDPIYFYALYRHQSSVAASALLPQSCWEWISLAAISTNSMHLRHNFRLLLLAVLYTCGQYNRPSISQNQILQSSQINKKNSATHPLLVAHRLDPLSILQFLAQQNNLPHLVSLLKGLCNTPDKWFHFSLRAWRHCESPSYHRHEAALRDLLVAPAGTPSAPALLLRRCVHCCK